MACSHIPKPCFHLGSTESALTSLFRNTSLTLVAWMKILTNSSIRLRDCNTACLSSNSFDRQLDAKNVHCVGELTRSYSHSFTIIIRNISLYPFPVYVAFSFRFWVIVESSGDVAVSDQARCHWYLKSKPILWLSDIKNVSKSNQLSQL